MIEANDVEQVLAEIDTVDRGILGCVSNHPQFLLLDASTMRLEGGQVIPLMVGSAAKREAVAHLQAMMGLSERRTCSFVGAFAR